MKKIHLGKAAKQNISLSMNGYEKILDQQTIARIKNVQESPKTFNGHWNTATTIHMIVKHINSFVFPATSIMTWPIKHEKKSVPQKLAIQQRG